VKIATGSIAVGMAVMILTVTIVTGFKNEIRKRAIGFAGHIIIGAYTNNNSYEQEPIPMNAAFRQKLDQSPDIEHIQPFATKNAIIKTAYENQGIVLKGVDKDYHWAFISQYLVEGKVPDYGDSSNSRMILVSNTIASRLSIKPGDKLLTYFVGKKKSADSSNNGGYEQRVRKYEVCGIYQTGFADVDDHIVFASLAQIQRLNYWNNNEAGGFEIELKDFSKLDAMTEWTNDEIGQGLEARSIKDIYPTLFSWLDLLDSNAEIIIVLMIAVAVINMISALLILILERSNTIGILKALGADNGLVQRVFLFQSVRILGKGLLIGNVVGLVLAGIQMLFKLVSLNPATYYVSFVPVQFHLTGLLAINILTMLACLLMMLLPVLVISKITPARTLRFK
jgi:lipoprotein-releasing system permease protein